MSPTRCAPLQARTGWRWGNARLGQVVGSRRTRIAPACFTFESTRRTERNETRSELKATVSAVYRKHAASNKESTLESMESVYQILRSLTGRKV